MLQIRKAKDEDSDFGQVCELIGQLDREFFDLSKTKVKDPKEAGLSRQLYTSWIQKTSCSCWISHKEELVVGFMRLECWDYPEDRLYSDKKYLKISEIVVHQDWRNKKELKVGESLFNHAVSIAREKNRDGIEVGTLGNALARGFYEHMFAKLTGGEKHPKEIEEINFKCPFSLIR